jgi:hypothetical protein
MGIWEGGSSTAFGVLFCVVSSSFESTASQLGTDNCRRGDCRDGPVRAALRLPGVRPRQGPPARGAARQPLRRLDQHVLRVRVPGGSAGRRPTRGLLPCAHSQKQLELC